MKLNGLRWWVIGLIALAGIINYIDRQTLNVLWPSIAEDLYPDKNTDQRKEIYSYISIIFVFSYAFGQAILAEFSIGLAQYWALYCQLAFGQLPLHFMHWPILLAFLPYLDPY